MSMPYYIMNTNKNMVAGGSGAPAPPHGARPPEVREKIMSYEEKTVGSTQFFKCEACPYMALAEDDIKFHLFTEHPDLAKRNGLADNIRIGCPGCSDSFDAEETLRNHLRNHHKMGIKDVKKMIKSLVQIALKDAKLKREETPNDPPPPVDIQIRRTRTPEARIPQVIEIPDVMSPTVSNSDTLPKGVAFISVDELNKMSTPNFEQYDPKDIIQEASINIVYSNEVAQFVNVSSAGVSTSSCSVLQVSSVTPDLISSIPRVTADIKTPSPQPKPNSIESMYRPIACKGPPKDSLIPPISCKGRAKDPPVPCEGYPKDPAIPCKGRPKGSNNISVTSIHSDKINTNTRSIQSDTDYLESESDLEASLVCGVNGCHVQMKDEEKLEYHRKCHRDGKLHCSEPECSKACANVQVLHTHLWKEHAVDMELPTCEVCGFKTFKRYRLLNIHMKIHGKIRAYMCYICSKTFKSHNQLTKHKLLHKKESNPMQCSQCHLTFSSERRLSHHVSAVHDKLRPYKCAQCEFTAARKEDVKLHARAHTGEKPYSCDVCMFQCADHNSMRRHKRTHTKEMLYKCKYCPYTTIQSTRLRAHTIIKHPTLDTDTYKCPYCRFRSISKEKYVLHLTTHTDKEGIQLLIEMTKDKAAKMNANTQKPNWTITVPSTDQHPNQDVTKEQSQEAVETSNAIDVDTYDCDSLLENMPQDYSKTYTSTTSNQHQQQDFNNQSLVQDLSKDGNNSDCLISENSSETMLERRQYPASIPLPLSYENPQSNIHGFLPNVSLNQNLILQNNSTITTNLSPISSNMSNNIMSNFPIRLPPLPPAPQISRNITLTPVDKISIPITSKVTGPIIKPTQILPVPSSSNSPPVNFSTSISYDDGAPRKKPKISVKSNLILKGPDQVNMFHSQQKMAFKQLEDSERFGCPVTFNNLITTQFMQLPTPALSDSPSGILNYQEPMMGESSTTPNDTRIDDNAQMFTFNQQLNVNQMTLLPPTEKIQTTDPSYIKLEANIKQNTQSPSLERMCNANLLNNQALTREYKASPPLEDIHKNMNEIKNEVKSDFYNQTLINNGNNSMMDQYLIENIIGEQYSGHLDLSAVVLPEELDDQQNDVIEIDDNSEDNKLLPRYDMTFPLEPLYLMHNDFHFLESDNIINMATSDVPVNEITRMVAEVPLPKESLDIPSEGSSQDFPNFIQGKKDPMMNTSVRPTTNKINVKNIELMKN